MEITFNPKNQLTYYFNPYLNGGSLKGYLATNTRFGLKINNFSVVGDTDYIGDIRWQYPGEAPKYAEKKIISLLKKEIKILNKMLTSEK